MHTKTVLREIRRKLQLRGLHLRGENPGLSSIREGDPPAAGAEEEGGVSVEVAEWMALRDRFMDRLGQLAIDPVAFEPGINDLTETFGKDAEIQMLKQQGVRLLLLMPPDRISLRSASPESATRKLLVQDGFKKRIEQELFTGLFELTEKPDLADFVIGDQEFVRAQRRLVSERTVLLQVTPSTVGQVTERFLAAIASQRNELEPRAVILMGTQDQRTGAIPLLESA